LPFLGFACNDGGRGQYFDKHLESEIPDDIQDCSVIAVSLATTYNLEVMSPALSYRDALWSLLEWNERIKPWRRKQYYETYRDYWRRRICELLENITATDTPRYEDPIYGTNTNTYSNYLQILGGYSQVFGEPIDAKEYCLCATNRTLVIDGYRVLDGEESYDTAHVTVVRNGMVVGPTNISHGNFRVLHVWQRTW
jgi:hypothetical protein